MATMTPNYEGLYSLLSTRVVLQMTDDIYLDRPDVAPLIAFMTKAGKKRTVQNMEFHYLTKEVRPTYVSTQGITDHATADITVTLTTAGDYVHFMPKMQVWGNDQYRIQYIVKSVDTTGTIVIARSHSQLGDVTHNLPSGGYLILGPQVYGDLADAPKGTFRDAVDNSNYCAQHMTGVTLGEIMTKTKLYGTDVRMLEHKEKLMEFKTDMEAKFLFSKKAKDETNVADADIGTVYYTGGVDEIITASSNILNFGSAAFDWDTLVAALPDMMEFRTSGSQYAFYGCHDFGNQLELLQRDKLFIDPNNTSWGQVVTQVKTTYGAFPIVPSRLCDRLADHTTYLLDMNELSHVSFAGEEGPEPKLYLNAQLTSQPNKLWDFYRAISGIERGTAKRQNKIWGWA